MTIKQYLQDDSLKGEVTITDITAGEENIIRVKETWFHPQGGGQKADIGTIGLINVIKVRHAEGGEVDHIVDSVDGIAVNQNYPFAIDEGARLINAAYHTAGHLIAAIGDSVSSNVKGVQGHHWPGEARVDFDGAPEDMDAFKAALQQGVDKAVQDSITVTMSGDPFESRAVDIAGSGPVPCGGTHLKDLSVIKKIEIGKVKHKKGQTRVRYEVEVHNV